MNSRGHNERSFRLDALAAEAREGLEKVEQGEEFTIGGWLAYGHALNEGRALFPGDKEFGEWVALCQLDTADRHDRAAAMWAAANADQFEEARQRGNPRTIRGIHAKWKEIEAERAEAERAEAERQESGNRCHSDAEETQPKTNQDTPPTHAEGAGTPDAVAKGAGGDGDITTAPVQEPERAADPYGYAKLTDEALLAAANGLHEQLLEEKQRRKQAEAERDRLKAEVKGFEGDQAETIRRLSKTIKHKDSEIQRANDKFAAEKRKTYALKKQIEDMTGEEVAL